MLTDATIKALKPKDKLYKIADRDGMYVVVQPSGSVVFRYDYRMNGRRETLTLGRYGAAGLSLARAREKLIDAQRAIREGRSPAQEKQREKRRIKEAKSFGEFAERWLQEHRMAESTRAMRRAIYERDILPTFRNRLLTEINPEDLRAMCAKVKERGAPATAVHIRDIVKLVYSFAILHGEKVPNPAETEHNPYHMLERAIGVAAVCMRRLIECRLVTDRFRDTALEVHEVLAKADADWREPFVSRTASEIFNNYDLTARRAEKRIPKVISDKMLHARVIGVLSGNAFMPDGLLIASDTQSKSQLFHFTPPEIASIFDAFLDDRVQSSTDGYLDKDGDFKGTRKVFAIRD